MTTTTPIPTYEQPPFLPSSLPIIHCRPPSPEVAAELGNSGKIIKVRSVFSGNVDEEIKLIGLLIDRYPFVSMHAEFPDIAPKPYSDPFAHYETLKSDVESLKVVRLGITLSDSAGNLPDLGRPDRCYIWEFNMTDLDIAHAPPKSIDPDEFETTRRFGMSTSCFSVLVMSSGLLCNEDVTYVTFDGGYEFGYLIKAVTGKPLPTTLSEFLNLIEVYFGNMVYDVKQMMKYFRGGLDSVAQSLGVKRTAVGKCHHRHRRGAGSDSLLTWHAYKRIRDNLFNININVIPEMYAGVLYRLEPEPQPGVVVGAPPISPSAAVRQTPSAREESGIIIHK